MLKSLQKAFKVKEVRDRLLYTFMMLVVIRIGCCLPIPGVDPSYLHDFFSNLQNSGMGFFNAITGGSFSSMSIFALSITPYITSSIIMQLLTIAIPKLEEMQKDGEDGRKKIAEYTRRLAKALHVKGLINIQFIAIGDEVYVIEVNPRSSRTVPYISKVTGIPIVDLATEVIIGKTIRELGYEPGLQPEAEYFAIKMPVFSFEKIRGAEISLGPEMKSTGECLGIAKTFNEALYKAFLGAGVELPKYKNMIITVKDADKGEAIEVGRRFEKLGYTIYATRSTAAALNEAGVKARKVNKISQESPTVMDLILGHKIDLVIDTPTQGRDKTRDGFLIRRTAIETGIYCITAMDTANALVTSMEHMNDCKELTLVDIAQL